MHKATFITHDTITHGVMSAEVDDMIAPLVKTMWKCRIITTNSCQGNSSKDPPWVELYFDELDMATRFIQLVYEPSEDALIYAQNKLPITWDYWKWKMNIIPMWYMGAIEYSICVSFPQTEIENIHSKLKQKLALFKGK